MRTLWLLPVLLCPISLPAAEPAATQPATAQTPTELNAKKALDRMVGTWKKVNKYSKFAGTEADKDTEAIETAEWILDGRWLQNDCVNLPSRKKSRFLTTYDAAANVFRAWYFDNQGGHDEVTGEWDEKTLTMNWRFAKPDHEPKLTGYWRFDGADKWELKMVVSDAQGQVLLDMTSTATRQPDGKKP